MPKRTARRGRHTEASNTYRFFVEPGAIGEHEALIDAPDLTHQMTNVLRLAPGMTVTLLDNSGYEYTVLLQALDRRAVRGVVQERKPAAGEPQLRLILYLALTKGERLEWALQKCTELGASAFVPLICERSVADSEERGSAKHERWARIIREAAEQSRRGKLPELRPTQRFDAVCEADNAAERRLLLWEGEGGVGLRTALNSLRSAPDQQRTALALFCGPEGGWTDAEIAKAIMYNVTLITLGPRILRAETAPVAATAAIMYEYGDLQ